MSHKRPWRTRKARREYASCMPDTYEFYGDGYDELCDDRSPSEGLVWLRKNPEYLEDYLKFPCDRDWGAGEYDLLGDHLEKQGYKNPEDALNSLVPDLMVPLWVTYDLPWWAREALNERLKED